MGLCLAAELGRSALLRVMWQKPCENPKNNATLACHLRLIVGKECGVIIKTPKKAKVYEVPIRTVVILGVGFLIGVMLQVLVWLLH